MSCGHCLSAVNRALREVSGVEVQSVRIGRADLRYDEARTNPALISAAVEAAGYATRVA